MRKATENRFIDGFSFTKGLLHTFENQNIRIDRKTNRENNSRDRSEGKNNSEEFYDRDQQE